MLPTEARARHLRTLASHLETEPSLRASLEAWLSSLEKAGVCGGREAGARMSLSASVDVALQPLVHSFGSDLAEIVAALDLQRRLGASGSSLLHLLVDRIEDAAADEESSAAAVSGTKLSSRLVAALPLAFLLLAPMARAPLADGLGLTLIAIGLALAGCGRQWMRKLEPAAPARDPVVTFCDIASLMLRSGASPVDAMTTAARNTSAEFANAFRTVEHEGWRRALSAVPEASEIAAILDHGKRLGIGVAGSLNLVASIRRRRAASEFERQVHRAPVLMVLPLVLCILPSFCFLALGPFLRALLVAG